MKKRDRRQDILQAAEHLVRNRRYHEIKLDEIATEAGVGKGTLYLYFKDKDDIYYQLVAEGFDALSNLVDEAASSILSFNEKLMQMVKVNVEFIGRRHTLIRLVMSEEQRRSDDSVSIRKGRLREHRQRLHQAHERLLQQGVDEGILRNDIAVRVLAHQLMGLMHARHIMEKMDDLSVSVEDLIDLFLHGSAAKQKGAMAAGKTSPKPTTKRPGRK